MKTVEEVINKYFKAWNEGFISENGDEIRNFMSQDFVGYWAHSEITQPEPYFYSYDLNGVLSQMDDAKKTFEIYAVIERNNGSQRVVMGRETNVIGGQPFTGTVHVYLEA